jgi:hypothetical protein
MIEFAELDAHNFRELEPFLPSKDQPVIAGNLKFAAPKYCAAQVRGQRLNKE